MKALIVLGSSSTHSRTREAVRFLVQRLTARGATASLLDLAVECTRVQEMAHYDNPPCESQTAKIRAFVASADVVLLATPVHHASFSGLIKSGLDHLAARAFEGKPVGIVSMSGSARSAAAVCDQLRSVVRALGGWATPTHVGLFSGDLLNGAVTTEIAPRIDAMIGELILFANASGGASPAEGLLVRGAA
jgi:NAD(P)H-dependent FMN reductase